MITYQDVADYFIAAGNMFDDVVTNQRLQKLVYYTQAWHFANYQRPLFKAEFHAGIHGPIIPELYRQYKNHDRRIPLDIITMYEVGSRLDKDTLDWLGEIRDAYMHFTEYELERMVKVEDPWRRARTDLWHNEPSNKIISEHIMMKYYSYLRELEN